MGFYIRKGISFGPFRLNLSRSGLGASFGVKGARIGIGPRGSYIHMGRAGLYYRQSLRSSQAPSHNEFPVAPKAVPTDDLHEITSAPAATLVDSSAAELLRELNRVKKRVELLPIAAIAGGLALLTLAMLGATWWEWVLAGLVTVAMAAGARHYDVTDGTVILRYSLEAEAARQFSNLETMFQRFAACQRVWHVDAAGHTGDWKRNAGVNTLVRRSDIRPGPSRPPRVECNMNVPALKGSRKSLYFFPDRILVYDSAGVGAVPYAEIEAQAGQGRFVEDGRAPSDAQQVGTTWRYVNKKGGPDRRFSDNRQLPIMLYGDLALCSSSGLRELFQCSNAGTATDLAHALEGMKRQRESAA